jgi:hypothetical protein
MQRLFPFAMQQIDLAQRVIFQSLQSPSVGAIIDGAALLESLP